MASKQWRWKVIGCVKSECLSYLSRVKKIHFIRLLLGVMFAASLLPYCAAFVGAERTFISREVAYTLSMIGIFLGGIAFLPSLEWRGVRIFWRTNHFFIAYIASLIVTAFARFLLGRGDVSLEVLGRLFSFVLVSLIAYGIFPSLLLVPGLFLYWTRLMTIIAFFVGGIAVLGILEVPPFFSLINIKEYMPFLKVMSTSSIFYEPNIFAAVLLCGALSCLYDFLRTTSLIWRLSLMAIFSVITGGLILSWSRGAWMCLSVGGALMVLVWFYRWSKRGLCFFGLLASALLVVFVVTNLNVVSSALSLNDILTGRVGLWRTGVNAILQAPLIGYGVGQIDMQKVLWFGGARHLTTHQVFVDQGIMSGLVAMTLYALIFLSGFWSLWCYETTDWLKKSFLFSLGLAMFLFIQFSPHNIGGASYFSLQLAIVFGLFNILGGERGMRQFD